VLAGQPELGDRLNDPSLRQLKQRVVLRCELLPLSLPESAAYIATRIRAAGGHAIQLFTREAVRDIHAASRGIPRAISVLCDNALVAGFARGERPVGRAILEEVARDFDLGMPVAVVAPGEGPPAADPDVAARLISPGSAAWGGPQDVRALAEETTGGGAADLRGTAAVTRDGGKRRLFAAFSRSRFLF
jgi:hypothetical protein